MRFSNGSFASPVLGNAEVAGICQLLSRPGESCTKKQCFDNGIHDTAETAQSLLVLCDYKALGEGAQSRVVVGSMVHPEILELFPDAVLVYCFRGTSNVH